MNERVTSLSFYQPSRLVLVLLVFLKGIQALTALRDQCLKNTLPRGVSVAFLGVGKLKHGEREASCSRSRRELVAEPEIAPRSY